MTFLQWFRRLVGTQPDAAKPARQETMRRASREHSQGARDLVKAARKAGSLSVQIERDLSGRDRSGLAD